MSNEDLLSPSSGEVNNLRRKEGSYLIGLSLSFCVRDIANGVVNIDDVEKIITGTRCDSAESWSYLLEQYGGTYWNGIEAKAEAILIVLLKNEKIFQPRTIGELPPNISKGIWVEDENSLAKNRNCSDCSIFEVLGCPLELQTQRYPEEYRQPLVLTFKSETTPYQLGCFYFQKK